MDSTPHSGLQKLEGARGVFAQTHTGGLELEHSEGNGSAHCVLLQKLKSPEAAAPLWSGPFAEEQKREATHRSGQEPLENLISSASEGATNIVREVSGSVVNAF